MSFSETVSVMVPATVQISDAAPGLPALEPGGGTASGPPLGAPLPDPRQGASSLDPHLCALRAFFGWPVP